MNVIYRIHLWFRRQIGPALIECKWVHLCAWAEITGAIGTHRMNRAAVRRCAEFHEWRERMSAALRRMLDAQTVNLDDPDEVEASRIVFGKSNRFIRYGRKS